VRVPRLLARFVRSRMSLRSHLIALVLVTLVPALVFCGVLVVALVGHARSLLSVVGAGLALLVLAGGLATLIARRIAIAIESLSPASNALARGAPAPPRALSVVTEMDAVARDLAEATVAFTA